MNNKLNKGIAELRAVKMTAGEKASVLHNVMAKVAPAASPKYLHTKKVPTPYLIPGFQIWIGRHRMVGTAMAAVLIVLISGSGVAFASEKALPGDALYSVKVAVTEPIRTALKTTPEAQAAWQAHLADERLNEAETLAEQGRLDELKQREIETLLAKHTAAFEVAANAAKDDEEVENTDSGNAGTQNTQVAENTDSETENSDTKVAAKTSLALRTTAAPMAMNFSAAAPAISRSQQLKNELSAKLRERAQQLEDTSRANASSTNRVEVHGVAEAARWNAVNVERGTSSQNSRSVRNKETNKETKRDDSNTVKPVTTEDTSPKTAEVVASTTIKVEVDVDKHDETTKNVESTSASVEDAVQQLPIKPKVLWR